MSDLIIWFLLGLCTGMFVMCVGFIILGIGINIGMVKTKAKKEVVVKNE